MDLLNADSAIYWAWAGEIRAEGLIGAQPFFLSPLYSYLLAAARTLLGDEVMPILAAQIVLGALTVVLVTDTSRRLATPAIAAWVGIGLAGYGMAVFFDLMVLAESVLLFLGSLAMWLLAHNGRGSLAFVGAAIGVMALGRPTFLLLLVPCVALAWVHGRSTRLRTAAAILCLPALAAAVTGLHHLRTAGAWIPFTYSAGFNFHVGHGPQANGTYVPFAHVHDQHAGGPARGGTQWDGRAYILATEGLRLSPAESSEYWWDRTLEHVRKEPLRAAGLIARKVGLLLNRREMPQIVDARVYERACGPLGWPGWLAFVALAGGATLGIPVAWRRGGVSRALVGWTLALVVGGAAFFVVDRYRIHLVPPMAVLTAVGVSDLVRRVQERDWRRVGRLGGMGSLGCAIAFAPAIGEDQNLDWLHATTMGEAWLSRGDSRRAAEWLEKAIAIDERGGLRGSTTATGMQSRAAAYENLGTARTQNGDDQGASAALATAVDLVPESGTTRAHYADVLASSGRAREAALHYELAGIPPAAAAGRLCEAAVENQRRGDLARTRRCLESALTIQPDLEEAIVPLVRIQIMTGDLVAARERLRDSRGAGLDGNVRRAHEAWILAMEGDTANARRRLTEVPASVRVGDPRVAGTIALMRETTGMSSP